MLASYSGDTQLQSLLLMLAHDEVHHAKTFRRIFARVQAVEQLSLRERSDIVLIGSQQANDLSRSTFCIRSGDFDGRLPFSAQTAERHAGRLAQITAAHYPFAAVEQRIAALFAKEVWLHRVLTRLISTLANRLTTRRAQVVFG